MLAPSLLRIDVGRLWTTPLQHESAGGEEDSSASLSDSSESHVLTTCERVGPNAADRLRLGYAVAGRRPSYPNSILVERAAT